MSDDLTPDDPFAADLGRQLHEAADGVDGHRVTRAAVDESVGLRRRRTARARTLVGVAAAAVALIGGVAVAGSVGDDGTQRISSAAPTMSDPAGTSQPLPPCPPTTTEPTTTAPPQTTTSIATPEGSTPFEQWASLLRDRGLLTPEQEDEIAAGRGISLTQEQSAVLQEYWDSQAGVTPTSTLVAPVDPVDQVPTTDDGTGFGEPCRSRQPGSTTTTPTTSIAPGGSEAASSEQGVWAVYLYILEGHRNPDDSIMTGLERMAEIMKGSEPNQKTLAANARAAAAAHGLVAWEGTLDCDEGATAALGIDPALEPLGISVTFPLEGIAQAEVDQFRREGIGASDPVLLERSCPGRGVPG